VKKRLEFITRLKAIIIGRQAEILDRIQADTGKSRTDALTAEIFGTLDHLDYLEKNAARILADRKVPTPFALMGKKSKIYFEPMGTTLIISPVELPLLPGHRPHHPLLRGGQRRYLQALQCHAA
jgi:acyl-CoA reductase-like NAD-dependent aldehyde dehydrogenase